MSLSARILPNYNYDDYRQWEGRWEVIEGIPYAMSPMPSPKHQALAGKLHAAFLKALEKNKDCACEVYQPIDLKIAENTIVNPDLSIVCQPIEKQYLDFPPVLVIEILSPSTKMKDQFTKYELYQDFGIQYYLLVDPEEETLFIYQLNDKGEYQKNETGTLFELTDHCQITPDLEQIW